MVLEKRKQSNKKQNILNYCLNNNWLKRCNVQYHFVVSSRINPYYIWHIEKNKEKEGD